MQNKNILITGASGVLAQKLIKELLKEDYNIYALTRKINNETNTNGINYFLNNDFFNNKLDNITFDTVINCAFTQQMTAETVSDSVTFTKNFFLKISKMQVKKIINVSTQRVYGDYREESADENYPVNPSNVYALGKYFAEILCELIFKNSNIKYTNLRIASLIGLEYPERIINKMLVAAKKTGVITVQNGKQQFGYVYVDDMAEAIKLFVIKDAEKWEPVYNIGADEKITLLEIAKKIREKLEKKKYKISVKIKESDKKTLMNSNLFKKTFGWKPKTGVEDFINKAEDT